MAPGMRYGGRLTRHENGMQSNLLGPHVPKPNLPKHSNAVFAKQLQEKTTTKWRNLAYVQYREGPTALNRTLGRLQYQRPIS